MRNHLTQLPNHENNSPTLVSLASVPATSHNLDTSQILTKPVSAMPSDALREMTSDVDLRNQVLKAEKSLREEIHKAEEALKLKAQETAILKAKVVKAKELLKAEAQRIETLKSTEAVASKPKTGKPIQENLVLLNGRWISKQRTDNYIIQLAASTKDIELIELAREFSSYGPLAIYPFKKNKDGKLIYGLSSGLFESSIKAFNAASKLPKDSAQHGSWIRKVADVSSQIAIFQ